MTTSTLSWCEILGTSMASLRSKNPFMRGSFLSTSKNVLHSFASAPLGAMERAMPPDHEQGARGRLLLACCCCHLPFSTSNLSVHALASPSSTTSAPLSSYIFFLEDPIFPDNRESHINTSSFSPSPSLPAVLVCGLRSTPSVSTFSAKTLLLFCCIP